MSARERAALTFAEKLAIDHQKIDDALWAETRKHFSEAEIIELVAHTTLYIGWGRFNEIVGLDLKKVWGGRRPSRENTQAAWAKPKYTLQQVDNAGRALIGKVVLFGAAEIINNWRAIHSYPLNAMQVVLSRRAREIQPTSVVSRRIKRLPAIQQKLRRMTKRLTLSQMQDVGGCRAVLGSVSEVRKVVAAYKQKRRGARHVLIDEDDYITNPKNSGYRSYHLIYEYKSRGASGKPYSGRKIEIQIRSDLQHLWATAVETASTFQRQSLKSSSGDKQWLRFFVLAGSAFALRERTTPVPNTPTDRRILIKELRALANELQVEAKLETYAEG